MKNILFTILAFAILSFSNVTAQDNISSSNDDTSYSKWQARFRIISVIPSPDVDIPGLSEADLDISTAFTPELDFTYFFNKNIAAELILGTAKHNVDVAIPELDAEVDLGHVWLLPPTLNLQYHFYADGFKPYVGAGVNYTIFYGVDEGDLNDIEYDNAFGFSLQTGIDYNLNDKWFLNLDIKKLWLKTDVTLDNTTEAEVDINPLIIGLGVGLKL